MPVATWTIDQVRNVIYDKQYQNSDWTVTEEKPIQYGCQFVLANGTRINRFTTGKVDVQGTLGTVKDEATLIFRSPFSAYQSVPKPKVFVVYGHHRDSRDLVEAMIRDLGLNPIILDQIAGGGKTIIEQLESQIGNAAFACVLLTRDDEGHPASPRKRNIEHDRMLFWSLDWLLGN